MKSTRRILASFALPALLVLAAARPSPANGVGRAPLASGRGAISTIRYFSLSVADLPGGQVEGYALSHAPSTGSFVFVRVTSATPVRDTAGRRSLAAAGLVVASSPDVPDYLWPGRTTFFAIQDGGFDAQLPDRFLGLGNVPQGLGNLTIQQILALIGRPPAFMFLPILNGDLMVRNR